MTAGKRLDGLVRARETVANGSTPEDVCHHTIEGVEEFLGFDACEIYLEESGALDCTASSGSGTGEQGSIGRAVAWRAYRSGEPLLIRDATTEQFEGETGYGSVLAVPLGDHGVLQLADEEPAAFDDRSLALADLFGGYVAETLGTVRTVDGSSERDGQSSLPSELTDQVLEAADVMLVALDRSGQITFANRTAHEILDYAAGGLVGNDWFETCIPEQNRDEVREVFEQLIAGEVKPVDHYENPVLTSDDNERVIEWHNIVLRDDDGNITGTLSSGLDVTEQQCRKRQLEVTQRRYRTLLRAAPDPIFVADAETGEIIEANAAAAEVRGQPREELVGLHQTELHPADESDRYHEGFAQAIGETGPVRRLPDGSQVELVTDRGETVPVEINVDTVELPDRRVVFGLFRDISDRIEYEETIAGLGDTVSCLFADRIPAVAGSFVETTTNLFGADSAAVYRYDETEGLLQPVHPSPEPDGPADGSAAGPADVGDWPVIGPGESVAWRVFVDGEPAILDDNPTAEGESEEIFGPGTGIRSELLVPIGEHGIVVVARRERDAFDDRTSQLVEILGATVEAAFDAIQRERQLETREQQLEQRTERLERVEGTYRLIRELARVIARSESRDAIERTVCEQLLDTDVITFAWVGESGAAENVLHPRAWAGDGAGYLQDVDLTLADGVGPAASAVRGQQPVTVQNTAAGLSGEPWRDEAVRRGFGSVLALPIVYQHTTIGVLAVYASQQDAFDELLRSVLGNLSDLLAHAIVTTTRKQALYAEATTELEFEIRDPNCFFLRFAEQTGCTLELERIVPEGDGTWCVFVALPDEYRQACLELAHEAPEIDKVRLVETGDRPLLELCLSEPFFVSTLANQGIVVRNITADSSGCRVTVAVPSHLSPNTVAEVISTIYPRSRLFAKHQQSESIDVTASVRERGLDRLTSRQQEVLETAYRCGYFESPKEATGAEVAEKLGLSTSAFHAHRRAAERTLVGIAIDRDDPDAIDGPAYE